MIAMRLTKLLAEAESDDPMPRGAGFPQSKIRANSATGAFTFAAARKCWKTDGSVECCIPPAKGKKQPVKGKDS